MHVLLVEPRLWVFSEHWSDQTPAICNRISRCVKLPISYQIRYWLGRNKYVSLDQTWMQKQTRAHVSWLPFYARGNLISRKWDMRQDKNQDNVWQGTGSRTEYLGPAWMVELPNARNEYTDYKHSGPPTSLYYSKIGKPASWRRCYVPATTNYVFGTILGYNVNQCESM